MLVNQINNYKIIYLGERGDVGPILKGEKGLPGRPGKNGRDVSLLKYQLGVIHIQYQRKMFEKGA